MRRKLIWIAPLAILAIVAFIALGGEIVMQLWNWLLPTLFAVREITFWQALGILVLCRILFGGFGCGGPRGPRMRLRTKWDAMTPEERERFREGMRRRCGFGPSTGEPSAGAPSTGESPAQ
jgi:hypothetical protein